MVEDLKERETGMKEKKENEEDIDEEELQEFQDKQKALKELGFQDLIFDWNFKTGFVENIKQIKLNYKKRNSLICNKICIIGPPFSGKTKLAEALAKKFNLTIINPRILREKYSKLENELGDEIRNFLEEKKTQLIEANKEQIEKNKVQKKFKIAKKIDENDLEIELSERILLKLYKNEISKNLYINRGYILDGFPTNYKTAFKLFKSILIRKKTKRK